MGNSTLTSEPWDALATQQPQGTGGKWTDLIKSLAGGPAGIAMYLGGQLVGGALDLFGQGEQLKEVRKAREEARRIDERNFAEDVRRNRFAESMATKNLGLQTQNLALATDTAAKNYEIANRQTEIAEFQQNYGISKDKLQAIAGVLNNNEAARSLVIQKWGI